MLFDLLTCITNLIKLLFKYNTFAQPLQNNLFIRLRSKIIAHGLPIVTITFEIAYHLLKKE